MMEIQLLNNEECFNSNITGYVITTYENTNKKYYEGHVINGKAQNKGKEYYDNGNLKYEGNFKNGKYDGYGKLYKNEVLKYEGQFINGISLENKICIIQ